MSIVDAQTLGTVTVSFNPDIPLLEKQLRALPPACTKVVVDNASRPELAAQVGSLVRAVPNAIIVHGDTNIGLAAAVNRGVAVLANFRVAPKFVLLLDQDSEPRAESVQTLIRAFEALEARGERVGCVGPALRDPEIGLMHGFHQCTRWRWKRVYPAAGSTEPVPCANLNGSGTLARVALFQELRGLDETFFIDHVDTEWAFRVLAAGYSLWGIPSAIFDHRMGQASVRFWWFGWRLWPSRSPQRHYYLFRNAVALMRRGYVPRVWKVWAVAKLVVTFAVTAVLGPNRSWQVTGMWRGVRNGCSGNYAR